jgi:hypothetical protein
MASISGLFPDPPKPLGFIWLAAITAESLLEKAELLLVSLELFEASLEVPDAALKQIENILKPALFQSHRKGM